MPTTPPTVTYIAYKDPVEFSWADWYGFLTSAEYRTHWFGDHYRAGKLPRGNKQVNDVNSWYNNRLYEFQAIWKACRLNTPGSASAVETWLRWLAAQGGVQDLDYVHPAGDGSSQWFTMKPMYERVIQVLASTQVNTVCKPARNTNSNGTEARMCHVRIPVDLLDPTEGVTEQVVAALRAYRGVSAPEHQSKVVMAPDGLLARLAAQKAQKDS
jgi:hypothetical protein